MRKYMMKAGFSLMEEGVTERENEMPAMNSVVVDWRNQCERKSFVCLFPDLDTCAQVM